MQVTSQHLIEQSIMKENSNMFILAYSSLLLQEETMHDLGYSSQGQLSRNVLLQKAFLETSDALLKDLLKLFHNSLHSKNRPFVTVAQWNEHWSHSVEKKNIHYRVCAMDIT